MQSLNKFNYIYLYQRIVGVNDAIDETGTDANKETVEVRVQSIAHQ